MDPFPMEPLPGDWPDLAFHEANQRLRENPSALTDADMSLFLRAHGGTFAESAEVARATGVSPIAASKAYFLAHEKEPATLGMVNALVDVVLLGFRNLRVSKRLLALEDRLRAGGASVKEIGVVVPDADRLAERLTAIEARLTALEARPKGLQYLGVWKEGSVYEQGDVVTRSGGMWVCKVNHCQSVPGADGGVGFQLAVKSGRDGRDLR